MLRGINPPLFSPSSAQQQPPLRPFRFLPLRSLSHDMAESDSSDCEIVGRTRRRGAPSSTPQPLASVIDLTKDSPPQTHRRSPTILLQGLSYPVERPPKRRRIDHEAENDVGEGPSGSNTSSQVLAVDLTADDCDELEVVDELDLTGQENDLALQKLQEQQRQRHTDQERLQDEQNQRTIQGQSQLQGPTKLSQVQCVICMDAMTDLTATHCGKSHVSIGSTMLMSRVGHVFCYKCIMDALIADETDENRKGPSKCPVCRMKVLRKPRTALPHIIPLELKFSTRKSVKGKERARD